ncbi:MAG: 16S rRNA (cytosine(1402)-N(4))-methyltransferase RsmH [Bdellovibrionales bacterium]|nr:16S rRNA (cytosine(1402)-N(4))-methyltransferase RsmH [Bdellovibrionales bacterium]
MPTQIVSFLIEPFQREPGTYLDCTLGGGGHVAAMMAAMDKTPFSREHRVIAVDQDIEAINRAQKRFQSEVSAGRLILQHSRFSEISVSSAFPPVLGVLADLGFSSDQIDSAQRGMSFRLEGPLDMRLDQSRGESAYQLLMRLSEREIADILFELGEERLSRKIARKIIEARESSQFTDSTRALADLVSRAFPPAQRFGRLHPATRTFQALRIAVNDELGELDQLLNHVLPLVMKPGGLAAILSFHSLEDRRVKRIFQKKDDGWTPLVKKPVEAEESEVESNPRARSAKLRVAEWRGMVTG